MSDNKKRQRAEATPLPVYQKYGPTVMTTHDGSKTASQTMAFGIMTVLPNFTLDQLVIISAHLNAVGSKIIDESVFHHSKDVIQPDLRTLLIFHVSWWLSYLYFVKDNGDARLMLASTPFAKIQPLPRQCHGMIWPWFIRPNIYTP
jgi:hypothetical protein